MREGGEGREGHAGAHMRTGSTLRGECNWIGFAASGMSFGHHFITAPLAGIQGAGSMQPDPLGQDSLAIAQRGGLVAHSDLDERAIEALKEFNEDGALAIFQQFNDSDLSHVQNKSAFLCGVMKTYRQREKQGTKVAYSSKGPDEAKIKALLGRTGYTLDVTTGQRKYGGLPPDSVYSGQQPSVGTELFVGKIPRDLFEDELVPLFEKAGPIWDLRLMMDPLTGLNRGYAFVTFCTKKKQLRRLLNCIIIMKFVLENILVSASRLPTIGFLWALFLRVKPRNRFLKNLAK